MSEYVKVLERILADHIGVMNDYAPDFEKRALTEETEALRAAITALNSPQVPAGWKAVPIDPVASMVDAGVKHEPWSDYSRVRMIYRSMIAAAPTAPGGAGHDD